MGTLESSTPQHPHGLQVTACGVREWPSQEWATGPESQSVGAPDAALGSPRAPARSGARKQRRLGAPRSEPGPQAARAVAIRCE